jgi:hypothetical protein
LQIGYEFTWEGRPNNTMNILAPLRDQKAGMQYCHKILTYIYKEIYPSMLLFLIFTPLSWITSSNFIHADTCTFEAILGTVESLNRFKCSCLKPPQVFVWHLCLNDLKCRYEEIITTELASEESSKRGKLRLETGLDTIKEHGVIGSHKDEPKVRFAFRFTNLPWTIR